MRSSNTRFPFVLRIWRVGYWYAARRNFYFFPRTPLAINSRGSLWYNERKIFPSTYVIIYFRLTFFAIFISLKISLDYYFRLYAITSFVLRAQKSSRKVHHARQYLRCTCFGESTHLHPCNSRISLERILATEIYTSVTVLLLVYA